MTILRPDRPDQYDAEVAALLPSAFAHRKHGTLWTGGGMGEQPALWMQACAIVSATVEECDAEYARRLAKK